MFLLVTAHPGFPGQIPQSRKTVVVCVEQFSYSLPMFWIGIWGVLQKWLPFNWNNNTWLTLARLPVS